MEMGLLKRSILLLVSENEKKNTMVVFHLIPDYNSTHVEHVVVNLNIYNQGNPDLNE